MRRPVVTLALRRIVNFYIYVWETRLENISSAVSLSVLVCLHCAAPYWAHEVPVVQIWGESSLCRHRGTIVQSGVPAHVRGVC